MKKITILTILITALIAFVTNCETNIDWDS